MKPIHFSTHLEAAGVRIKSEAFKLHWQHGWQLLQPGAFRCEAPCCVAATAGTVVDGLKVLLLRLLKWMLFFLNMCLMIIIGMVFYSFYKFPSSLPFKSANPEIDLPEIWRLQPRPGSPVVTMVVSMLKWSCLG